MKPFTVVAMLAVLGMVVAGWAQAAAPVGQPAAAATAAVPPDAKLAVWMSQAYIEGADAFNRSQYEDWSKKTGVPVDVSYISPDQFDSKFRAALEAPETLPDIVQFDEIFFPLFYEAGKLIDISDVIADLSKSEGGISPGLIVGYTFDGKTYAVPWIVDPQLSYFRKDVFEAAGTTVPTTYDQFLEECKKVNKPPEMYCWGLNLNNNADPEAGMRALIWSLGGTVTDKTGTKATLDTPEVLKALQYVKAHNDIGSFPPDAISGDGVANNNWYETGITAFTENGGSIATWLLTNDPEAYTKTVVTTPLAGPAGAFMNSNVWTLGITTNSKYPDLAKQALEYIAGPEATLAYLKFVQYTQVSAYAEVAKQPIIQEDPLRKTAFETVAGTRSLAWPAPLSTAATEIYSQNILSKMAIAILSGKTPEEAAAEGQQAVQTILDRHAKSK